MILDSIKFICNGAKILRPGIVKFDSFSKNDIVVVKDEKFEKYISVGLALEDSNIAEKLKKVMLLITFIMLEINFGMLLKKFHFVYSTY